MLLADCFSGVRIGEKRWNVLWEGSCWRRGSIVRAPFSVKSILELFLSSLPAFRHSTPGFRLSLWAVAPPRSKVSTNACVVSRHPPHTLWCVPPTNFSTDRAFSPAFLPASSLLPTSGLAYVRFCPCRVALKRDPSSPWPPAFVRPACRSPLLSSGRRAVALASVFSSLHPIISVLLTSRR